MLLPVTQSTEAGGVAGRHPRHLGELVVAAVPPGSTGLSERRLQQKQAEGAEPTADVLPTTGSGTPDAAQGLSQRMARWEPVAIALGHSLKAVVGFLKSVGVPQAEAEDMARRAAEAAREQLKVDTRATQAHYEDGRLSVKLENVHIGFRRGKGEISVGKAEIGIDVDIPGARKEETGASLGDAEAEIGQRKVAFTYKGQGATPAFADRGATGVTFTVAAPLPAPQSTGSKTPGPVDVAI